MDSIVQSAIDMCWVRGSNAPGRISIVQQPWRRGGCQTGEDEEGELVVHIKHFVTVRLRDVRQCNSI